MLQMKNSICNFYEKRKIGFKKKNDTQGEGYKMEDIKEDMVLVYDH